MKPESKRQIYGVEIHRLSVKEKVPGTAVSKEGDVDFILGHETTY